MYLGKLVEVGPAEAVCTAPAHPYTRGLIDAIPVVSADPAAATANRGGLAGEPPDPTSPPSGCRFRTRCPRATGLCAEQEPPLLESAAPGQLVACHFPLQQAAQLRAAPRHSDGLNPARAMPPGLTGAAPPQLA
jgi:peptide/nickel transport system ATP-binding protein